MPVIPILGATATYALYASLATTAISGGLTAFGQAQQAQQARRTADYNATIQQQNANMNARLAQYQADANTKIALSRTDAANANATALNNQALGIETQGREQARRMREQKERALAATRAASASSGLVNEGTPLLVLSDNAIHAELGVQDTAYQTEMNSRAKRREAELQRYEGGFSLIDAGMQQYQGKAAEVGRRIAYREADLTRAIGKSNSQAYRLQAATTLVSSVGKAASAIS